MNAMIGWGLAVLAVAVGYLQWGWPGVVLGITLVAFWMVLQWSRVMRVMQQAGSAPIGRVPSAVMLHAKLRKGMRLLDILPLTRSLGQKVADDPETFEWGDESGARVRVELVNGRLHQWSLLREPAADAPPPA